MDISSEEIFAVITAEAAIDPEKLQPEATLKSLDIASLDMISIAFALEDKFGIILEIDHISACEDLQSLVDLIKAEARTLEPA